jgi:hypothetical protein
MPQKKKPSSRRTRRLAPVDADLATHPITDNMPPLPQLPALPLRIPDVMPPLPGLPPRIPDNFPPLPALPANAVPATAQDQQPPPTVPTFAKTKRRSMKLTVPERDEDRYQANAAATKAALEKVYDAYYDRGNWRGGRAQLDKLYNMMGVGEPGYLTTAATDADLQELVAQPDSRVKAQRWSGKEKADKEYAAKLGAYNANPQGKQPPKKPVGPNSNAEAIVRGDYFHIHNLNHEYHKEQERVRRIIVNVKTQQAGLKVARNLGALFQNPEVSPFLREYKIYLSKTANPNERVKHDKLVVYYETRRGSEDSPDSVGDKIVAAIEGAVTPDERGAEFAPFYSRVGPGIAWAEEPKYFVQSLSGSFTTTRSGIIEKVIKDNPTIASKEEFITLVNEALQKAKVDPVTAHRHLVPVT